MNSPLSRRAWLAKTAGAALAATALPSLSISRAAEGMPRLGGARLKLSLAAYSFRDFFKDTTAKNAPAPAADQAMDMFRFVDYCAEHHCDGAELTSYYFPKDVDNAYLLKLKRHAFLRGVGISGTAVGNNFVQPAGPARDKELAATKVWIDRCQILGAAHVRIFAGTKPKEMPQADAIKHCVETTRLACEYAAERGVFLGIENHGGIVEEPAALLEILQTVNSPWLGLNLDSGNFRTADPYADFAKCAPYAVNVQIKTEITPKGQPTQRADLKRFIQILRDTKYQGYVALEFEEKADPFKTVPGVLEELNRLIHAA